MNTEIFNRPQKTNLPRFFRLFHWGKIHLLLLGSFLALSALTPGSCHADQTSTSKVTPAQGNQYQLVMSNDDKICEHVQAVLNKDIERYGPDYDQRKFADPMFTAIHWEPTSDPIFRYGGDYARFDVNNNGKQELVVRFRSSVKSRSIQDLFVFDSRTEAASLKTVKDLQEKSIGKIDIHAYNLTFLPPLPRKEWMEKGKEYYPTLDRFVYIYPFILNGTTYLLIKDSPDIRLDPELALVSLYKGGVVRSADPERMRDLCYLKRKVRNATLQRY